jgi:hypothetical protein
MKNKNTILVFVTLLLLAVMSRMWSHMWNFTLVGGVFLFAGAYFKDRKIAVALMLSVMLISDYFIGFHSQMPAVYLGYLVVVGIGFLLNTDSIRSKVLGYSFVGTLSFYVITNFAVWFEGQLYPMSLAGLIDCYVMALPFYRNQLLSDLMSSLLIFEVARHVLVAAPVSSKTQN